jgi:D-alanyl-D-alanine carboxypeptidase
MTAGGRLYGGSPKMTKGVRLMQEYLAKVGVGEGRYFFENGSGLSHANRISARDVAGVLLAAAKDEKFGSDFIDSLAVGGVDGTLRSRFRGHPSEGRVRGKTGTLNGVATLSGFVDVDGGDEIVFSILTNGFRDRRKQAIRDEQARLVDALYAYLEARRDSAPAAAPTPEPAPEPAAPPAAEPPPSDDEDRPSQDDQIEETTPSAPPESPTDHEDCPPPVPPAS